MRKEKDMQKKIRICLDKQYTPADCRLMMPEEYDREYGEDETC